MEALGSATMRSGGCASCMPREAPPLPLGGETRRLWSSGAQRRGGAHLGASEAPRERRARVVAQESGNGAASKADPYAARYSSSISLERLLDASRTLGVPLAEQAVGEGGVPLGEGVASLAPRNIGDKAPCARCQALGSVECATCGASGLYLDPILESQGVLVKVRCLGCGGSGAIMCPTCGGRGHQGSH